MKIIKERRPNGTLRIATVNEEPSMTQQQFKDETDINLILEKYAKVGEITHLNSKTGVYADISEIGTYKESLDTVMKAEEAFNSLPAQVRKKFANNPAQIIDWLKDAKNKQEAIELGLINKDMLPPEPKPQGTPAPGSVPAGTPPPTKG